MSARKAAAKPTTTRPAPTKPATPAKQNAAKPAPIKPAPIKPVDIVAAKYRAAGWTVINMRAGTCTDLVATCAGNVHFIQIGERTTSIFVQNAMSNGARPVRAMGASLIDANTGMRVVLRSSAPSTKKAPLA